MAIPKKGFADCFEKWKGRSDVCEVPRGVLRRGRRRHCLSWVTVLYRMVKKYLRTWGAMENSTYSNNPHTVDDLKMAGHHRIHSDCRPCYTEHGL